MIGISAEALDAACGGARISRTVLRSDVLRILRGEPLDLMITSTLATFLTSEEFLAAFAARAAPVAVLVASRSPDPAALARLRGVGVLARSIPTLRDPEALREQVRTALLPPEPLPSEPLPPEPLPPEPTPRPIPRPTIATATRGPSGPDAAPTPTTDHYTGRGEEAMANINKTLEEAMKIDGAIAAALADWDSGLCLGTAGGGARLNIEVAAAGNCQVVKAKMATMHELGIQGGIHDILITLDDQVHLIRPLRKGESLFLYVAIDKTKGNLGLARHKLQKLESELNM